MELAEKRSREYLFDNIKALLLFLVAFGHTLDVYLENGAFEMTLMKYIYLFHMPLFAFVTGYFTKDLRKAREGAVAKCLFPYLIFQGLYILMGRLLIGLGLASFNSGVFNGSLLLPSSAFYYLLAVFVWKLSAESFFRFRYPLVLSVVLGLVISLTDMEEFHQGLGAVFSLLPFFVLGVLCTKEQVERIRRMPKWGAVLILLLGIFPAYYLPYAIHSVRMTYASVGFSALEGIMYRLAFYLSAATMGMALLALMPEQKLKISRIGEASVLVYAGSTFLAPHGYVLLAGYLGLGENRVLNLAAIVVYCLVLVVVCAIPLFLKWYRYLLKKIEGLLLK